MNKNIKEDLGVLKSLLKACKKYQAAVQKYQDLKALNDEFDLVFQKKKTSYQLKKKTNE